MVLEETARRIHNAICEESWDDCSEHEDGLCWKAARALEATTAQLFEPDYVLDEDGQVKSFMPFIKGKRFVCTQCKQRGGLFIKYIDPNHGEVFVCNLCKAEYTGE